LFLLSINEENKNKENNGPDPQPEGVRIPPPRSPPNKGRLLSTPNKQDMYNEEIVW